MPLKLIPTSPKRSLNAAFLKVRPLRSEIDAFKTNLIQLLDKVDESEREENQKTHVRDFLVNTYYMGKNEVNTKGAIDLAIHTGNTNKSTVGVIIEAKRPSNKSEWITAAKPNEKALHELVLYYMRERVDENNIDIKHLVLTNVYEWYVIDAAHFDKLFYQNKKFVKDYQAWSTGQKVTSETSLFYNDIAKPFIESLDEEIECTYFDLRMYEKELRNTDNTDDKKLIELQKLLSEFHLLKVPFANDSNKLDKRFYSELLHIIGLTEIKDGGKKLIGRHKEGERMIGTILEDTIMQLDSRDKLDRVKNVSQYGTTREERLFNIALELTITWVNRILFLKLLEGQLLSYHKGNKDYLFLNHGIIKEFDQLDALFFQVLAKRFEERNEHVSAKFNHVPYLNSSLFEPTELEHDTLFISNLSDDKTMPILAQTVLKTQNGGKRSGELSTLEYLFAFLEAYDFSGEGSEDIQEDNKPLINASVLGLIFEKINGYKDGSFFTPGFITMYMCRETIRRAVAQKFNEAKGWQCDTIDQLYDKIEDRTEANTLINSIKICDPAVGSGHFLVSALNEIIAIKSDLKILQDREGKRLKEYVIEVVNDELITKDIDGELYQYYPHSPESQRVQETLFHEKQTIIENCLFGVDINPNSVKICRLRLWIELLKNAYYKNKTELETLPNIDINIKCGNSLVSRFAIDADMKDVLKNAKQWSIQSYKLAVDGYRNAKTKEDKRQFESLIERIKTDFKSEVDKPFMKKISEARGKAEKLAMDITNLSAFGQKIDATTKKNLEAATANLTKLESEREDINSNKIFENAFEWRFEFPEVLNDDGDFVGFDVVIGNPPYMSSKDFDENLFNYLSQNFSTSQYQLDLYISFMERGINILRRSFYISLITPNSWLKNMMFSSCREYLLNIISFNTLFPNLPNVFDEASVDSLIFIAKKEIVDSRISVNTFINQKPSFKHLVDQYRFKNNNRFVFDVEIDDSIFLIIQKVKDNSVNLESKCEITRGVNPYDKYRGQSEEVIKTKAYHSNYKKDETFLPEIRGKHVNSYSHKWDDKHFISYGDWLAAPRDMKFFRGPRIIMRQVLSSKLNCTIIEEDMIIDQSVFIAKPKVEYEKYIYSMQAILASKLIAFYFKYSSNEFDALFPKIKIGEFKELPIPIKLDEFHRPLINYVHKIFEEKKINNLCDITDLESQIDQLVYELYGLTEEEISIVES